MIDPECWAEEFPVRKNIIYLNHAAVCPLPARTAAAVAEVAADYRDWGSTHHERWSAVMARGRGRLAELTGADECEIAFVKNTTAGLMLAAESIPWRDGENVVVADIEFPANVYPWLNLRRRGVTTRFVQARGSFPTVDDYAAACDDSTRVITSSWVQFSSGQRTDLAALSQLADDVGAFFVVDAIQGLGALQIDVSKLGIDFLAADGHKWLLSVEGCGLLYVSQGVIGDLEPFWRGWTAVPEPTDFLRYDQPALDDARRFEEGSPNLAGIAAMDASAGLLLEAGPAQVEERVLSLTERLIARLRDLGCEIASPTDPQSRSGIVCFRCGRASSDEVATRLAERGISAASRLGVVRLSPHFYNTEGEIDAATEAVGEIMAEISSA